jgi:succinate dehydrogenase hydrophobic anchor subunit
MVSTVLRSIGVVACLTGVLLLFSGDASANPIVPTDLRVTSDASGIVYLFTVNLPIDMFVFALALALVCMAVGPRTGNTSSGLRSFMLAVIAACVLIALAGAVIDFYLLFERVPGTYANDMYDFRLDLVRTTVACLLVFASVLLVSIFLVRTSWLAGLAIGAAVAVANLISWYALTLDYSVPFEEAYWLSLMFLVALAVPMHMLIALHSKRRVPA